MQTSNLGITLPFPMLFDLHKICMAAVHVTKLQCLRYVVTLLKVIEKLIKSLKKRLNSAPPEKFATI